MNWWKIGAFSLSAILAIGSLLLAKIERPLLTVFIVILIIISTGVAIRLEYLDTKEYNEQKKETVQWREKANKSLRKIDEQHSMIMEKDGKITTLEEQQEKLERNVEEVDKKARPNTISFFSKKIEQIETGYKIKLRFKPMKNESLGQLVFVANLQGISDSKILDFWPTTGGGAFQSGEDSKKISEDSRSARLIYSLMGPGYPTIELKVSMPTSVQIEGNHDLEPFILKIE